MSQSIDRRQLMRQGGIALAALAASPWLRAQTAARKLALMSMIGHQVELVETARQIGSRIPPRRIKLELGGLLDQRATLAMDKQARAFLPEKDVVLLSAQGSMWTELQRDAIASDNGMREMIATVADAAQRAQCSHALALIRHRTVARLQLAESTVGLGQLEGVGFYIDTELQTQTVGTAYSHKGVLATYAYMRLMLVDARQVKLLGSELTQVSSTVTLPPGTQGDPWDALTPEQKAKTLTGLVESSVEGMAPTLLKAHLSA